MTQLIAGGPIQSPPSAPTLLSPSGSINTPTPTFSWRASQGADQYYLWVTDSSGRPRVQTWYTGAALGCPSGTGTCTVTPGVALNRGNGVWWVQPWSAAGGYGPWSAGMSFRIDDSTPVAISPSGTVTSSPILFTWSSVPGATMYYVWINDSKGPVLQTWVNASTAGCANGGNCAVHASPWLAPGVGTWWVEAWGPTTGYSKWSNGRTFTVPSVGKPTLLAPTGLLPGGGTLEFSWLPVAGATDYYLWVTDSSGTPKIQRWFTAGQASCSVGACWVTVGATLNSGNGEWWIRAWSPNGLYGPWSEGMRFVR